MISRRYVVLMSAFPQPEMWSGSSDLRDYSQLISALCFLLPVNRGTSGYMIRNTSKCPDSQHIKSTCSRVLLSRSVAELQKHTGKFIIF